MGNIHSSLANQIAHILRANPFLTYIHIFSKQGCERLCLECKIAQDLKGDHD